MSVSGLKVEVFLTQNSQPEQGGTEEGQSLSGDHHPQTPDEIGDCQNYFRECWSDMHQTNVADRDSCTADLGCGESIEDRGVCTGAVLGKLSAR